MCLNCKNKFKKPIAFYGVMGYTHFAACGEKWMDMHKSGVTDT